MIHPSKIAPLLVELPKQRPDKAKALSSKEGNKTVPECPLTQDCRTERPCLGLASCGFPREVYLLEAGTGWNKGQGQQTPVTHLTHFCCCSLVLTFDVEDQTQALCTLSAFSTSDSFMTCFVFDEVPMLSQAGPMLGFPSVGNWVCVTTHG